MNKVLVFGSNGMLGRYVVKYLSNFFEVSSVTRNDLDLTNYGLEDLELVVGTHDVVINAAGLIKQRSPSNYDMVKVNSLFPIELADLCEMTGKKLIHISTDCVYSGTIGKYDENALHDALDAYGKTKSLGEPENATVVRASIIGEEQSNKHSFIEWVKTRKDSTADGYVNHLWNGITCLQFAKICRDIIINNHYWMGVRHIVSDTVSKYDMVKYTNETFDLNIQVNEVEADTVIDRTLSSNFGYFFDIPSVQKQIEELKGFEL